MIKKYFILFVFFVFILTVGGCEKDDKIMFNGPYKFYRLQINNQNYNDSLFYYYPNVRIDFLLINGSYTLKIGFVDKPCDECPFKIRGSYYYPLEDNVFKLKTPLWVRNTNRDANGEYVCDTCSYLKGLYGYEWAIDWDHADTVRFHAIAKDTLLLEITSSK